MRGLHHEAGLATIASLLPDYGHAGLFHAAMRDERNPTPSANPRHPLSDLMTESGPGTVR